MSADCVFCKIVKGELPSYKVAEDEHLVAILDIAPSSKGHTLVIPKVHCVDMFDMPDAYAKAFLPFAKHVACAVKDGMNADGVNIMQNNGEAAGQVVMHYHAHIIPRRNGDGLLGSVVMKNIPSKDEMAEIAQKIADKAQL